jgi:hypothetical protein
VGGAGRALRVLVAGEPQQQRVSPELDQAPAVPVRDGEESREDRPEDVRDLLGPHLAVTGQALGHLREPGDVHEDHRPVDLSEDRVGTLSQPAEQQPRDVRPEDLRALARWLRQDVPLNPGGLRVYPREMALRERDRGNGLPARPRGA